MIVLLSAIQIELVAHQFRNAMEQYPGPMTLEEMIENLTRLAAEHGPQNREVVETAIWENLDSQMDGLDNYYEYGALLNELFTVLRPILNQVVKPNTEDCWVRVERLNEYDYKLTLSTARHHPNRFNP